MIFYYLCVVAFCVPQASVILQNQLMGKIFITFSNFKAIVILVLIPFIAMIPDFGLRFVMKNFFPTPAEIILSQLSKRVKRSESTNSVAIELMLRKPDESRESKSIIKNYYYLIHITIFLFNLVLNNGAGFVNFNAFDNKKTENNMADTRNLELSPTPKALSSNKAFQTNLDEPMRRLSYQMKNQKYRSDFMVENIMKNKKMEGKYNLNYNFAEENER